MSNILSADTANKAIAGKILLPISDRLAQFLLFPIKKKLESNTNTYCCSLNLDVKYFY